MKPLVALLAVAFATICEAAPLTQPGAPAPRTSNPGIKKARWPKEPQAFIGLRFGVPLAEQIPEAPRGEQECSSYRCYDWSWQAKHATEQFFMMVDEDYAALNRNPDLGEISVLRAGVHIADSTVAGAWLTLRHLDWRKTVDLLEARFGKPGSIVEEQYSTGGGQSRSGFVYTWSGDSVTVRFSEYGSQIDESRITAKTTRWDRHLDRKSKENAEKHKSKL